MLNWFGKSLGHNPSYKAHPNSPFFIPFVNPLKWFFPAWLKGIGLFYLHFVRLLSFAVAQLGQNYYWTIWIHFMPKFSMILTLCGFKKELVYFEFIKKQATNQDSWEGMMDIQRKHSEARGIPLHSMLKIRRTRDLYLSDEVDKCSQWMICPLA